MQTLLDIYYLYLLLPTNTLSCYSKPDEGIDLDGLSLSGEAQLHQPMLKIDRDPVKDENSHEETAAVPSSADNSLAVCAVSWSQQSIDRVSQMSPELESSTEDEMSGLLSLVDV